MSAYTGYLVRLSNSAEARKLPGPSPRHAANEADPSLPRGERQVASGTGSEYNGSDFPVPVMPGGGMELDTPRSWALDLDAEASRIKYAGRSPHDSPAVLSLRQGNMADGGRLSAHDGAEDRGYKRVAFAPSPFAGEWSQREADTTDGYSTPFAASGGPDAAKYVRGRGSRPENQPDPSIVRPGILRRWFWAGDAARHVTRDYGIQITQPRDSYAAPPRQRMVRDMLTAAALPRSAGSFDDAVMSQSDYSAPAVGSSFGGF